LSLLKLLAGIIRRIKPLVDYSKSHIVITIEYLEIMQQKVIKKKIAEHFKETERKERKEQKDR
jgi:hypothetical protein